MAEAAPTRFDTRPLAAGARVALRVEYDGTPYSGWQSQPHLPQVRTVQDSLENALSKVAASPLRVHCAGRTDTGVHATAQWVHFDAPVSRSLKAWVLGGNAQLPASVRIADAREVASTFHARHSAIARRYDYLIYNASTASAILADRVLWIRDDLDAERMHRALQALLGERDFSSFRAASCQSRTPMRCLMAVSVVRRGNLLRVRLEANAFLHHMVRNIMGSLLVVGSGAAAEDWLVELLESRDRRLAGATAAPHGLYLTQVRYPETFAIPEAPELSLFP